MSCFFVLQYVSEHKPHFYTCYNISYKTKTTFVRICLGCKPTINLTMRFHCKITKEQPVFSSISLTFPILCSNDCMNPLSKVSLLALLATKEARQCQQNRGNLMIFQDTDALFVAKTRRHILICNCTKDKTFKLFIESNFLLEENAGVCRCI